MAFFLLKEEWHDHTFPSSCILCFPSAERRKKKKRKEDTCCIAWWMVHGA
jgi:hypothetical protein